MIVHHLPLWERLTASLVIVIMAALIGTSIGAVVVRYPWMGGVLLAFAALLVFFHTRIRRAYLDRDDISA